jgi:hypothetical protein
MPAQRHTSRSYLKIIFWPNLGVGASFLVLDILEYDCGLKLGSALILNQNLYFEMASNSKYLIIFNDVAESRRQETVSYNFPDLNIMMMSQTARAVAITYPVIPKSAVR